MKSLCAALLLLHAASCVTSDELADPPMSVTYIGNTGYIVECKEHKIAIDAILGGQKSEFYDIPSDSIVDLMRSGLPPFDSIDVIAVTHWHEDHFSADIVADYLVKNPNCRVVCPPQVVQLLALKKTYHSFEQQIVTVDAPLDSVTSFSYGGIQALILTSKHGSYFEVDSSGNNVDLHREVQHLEFLFAIDGRSFLHVGDVGLQDKNRYEFLRLGKDSIDIAFVQRWGCYDRASFGEVIVRERILARRIFFTHLPRGKGAQLASEPACDNYRNVTIPTYQLECWTVR